MHHSFYIFSFSELSKTSPWTEWVQTNRTSVGYLQQRFRFTCRANVETSKDIKTTFAKSQAKFCFNDQKGCYKPKELSNSLTSIETFSSVDTVLKNYCRQRKKLFKNYCSCRTLGVFLVCQKCGFGWLAPSYWDVLLNYLTALPNNFWEHKKNELLTGLLPKEKTRKQRPSKRTSNRKKTHG